MQIQHTITVSRKELLELITDALKERERFNSQFPAGQALDMELIEGFSGPTGDAWLIEWGTPKPESETPAADNIVAMPLTPATPTQP